MDKFTCIIMGLNDYLILMIDRVSYKPLHVINVTTQGFIKT